MKGKNGTKKLLHSKGTINKMKRQPTEQENVFANDASDKGLIAKIYKEFIQINTKKEKNNPIETDL